jgi:hypothetical protein
MGLLIFLLMATWKKGKELVWNKLKPASMPLDMFLEEMERNRKVPRVPGVALFMTANPEGTPIALLHNLKHNKVIHEHNVILTIVTDEVPQVEPAKRMQIVKLAMGFHRVTGGRVAIRRTDQSAPHDLLPEPRNHCPRPFQEYVPLEAVDIRRDVAQRAIRQLLLSNPGQPRRRTGNAG